MSGVRESSHLPAGAAADRRHARPRRLLHPPLRRRVREDRHEDPDIQRAAAGGAQCSH